MRAVGPRTPRSWTAAVSACRAKPHGVQYVMRASLGNAMAFEDTRRLRPQTTGHGKSQVLHLAAFLPTPGLHFGRFNLFARVNAIEPPRELREAPRIAEVRCGVCVLLGQDE